MVETVYTGEATVAGAGAFTGDGEVTPTLADDQAAIAALLVTLGVDQSALTSAEVSLVPQSTALALEDFYAAMCSDVLVARLPGESSDSPSCFLLNRDPPIRPAASPVQVVCPTQVLASTIAMSANAIAAAPADWGRLVAIDAARAFGLTLRQATQIGLPSIPPAPS